MNGNQSENTEYSDDNEKTPSTSASQSSNTSTSTGDTTKKDALSNLPYNIIGRISEFLTPEEESRLRVAKPAMSRSEREALRSKGNTPPLTTFFAPPQRTANHLVLTGRPNDLIKMLQKDPAIFFRTYEQSIDAAGQAFYNVAPADLIYFLCDDDMQMKVKEFAKQLPREQSEIFFTEWQAQHASRGRGGADLVLVTGAQPPQYESILRFHESLLYDHNTIVRSLLKNPDGVICYKDPDEQLHWYYANPNIQTLECIDIDIESQVAHKAEYDAFVARMSTMEPNTARRSSNQEHALICAIMRHQNSEKPIHLVREGIHYRQDGIDFIDTHYDFNRIVNAYLKCIRLYNINNSEVCNSVWRSELGHAQREVMWLVQRYCEKNRSFWPLAGNYKETPFVRTPLEIIKFDADTNGLIGTDQERLFDAKTGEFVSGFGHDDGFAIFKNCQSWAGATWSGFAVTGVLLVIDLVAVNRLCEDATQNAESRPEISASNSSGLTR